MAKIKQVEPLVYQVLDEQPETRSDDYLLLLEVLKTFVNSEISLESIFKNHVILGLPSLETITRCRRKLQERFSYLRANEQIRASEEEEFREYALNN